MFSLRAAVLLTAILGALFVATLQASLPADSHYIAGVVEFRTSRNRSLSSLENLQDNLKDYLKIIASDEALPTDIIIFPESTLNNNEQLTFVPAVNQNIIPCTATDANEYHDFLRAISCQARNTRKYVVINLTEKERCAHASLDPRPCAPNGLNIFNTNVVFDREGRIVSRYRKVNLYGEPKNTTYEPQFGVFNTDFGVTFGHFVCFDLLFYMPAQRMADKLGITDFILTSMWFGQLPFLTGVQIQSSWAYANDVNLLAAGASNPSSGSTGTGIYNGRQPPLVAVMNQRVGVRKLYVARVPKKVSARLTRAKRQLSTEPALYNIKPRLSQADIFLKRDYLENYNSVLVDLTQGNSLQRRLCYEDSFCCNFELKWLHLRNSTPEIKSYTYRLGVYEGWRSETVNATNQLKNCAIFSCTGTAIADCGRLFAENVQVQPQVAFSSIVIETTFPKAPQYLLMPNSLRENLLPLQVNSYKWTVTDMGNTNKVRYQLTTVVDDLLTFSVYGNYYDSMVKGNGEGGAACLALSSVLVALLASVLVLLN